jgi:hypothetical protein
MFMVLGNGRVVHTAQKAEEIPGVKYTTWNTRCIFIDSIQMSSIYSKNTPGIHNGVFPVVYFFSFLRSATQRSGLEHILSSISSQPPQDGRWAPFVPASYKNMALGEAQLTAPSSAPPSLASVVLSARPWPVVLVSL